MSASFASEWPVVRASVRTERSEERANERLAGGEQEARSPAARELARAKEEVVARAVSKWGDRAWKDAVDAISRRVKGGRSNPTSRAYYKLWEIFLSCGLRREVDKSLHLCEAPGSFVECVSDLRPTRGGDSWKWVAVSLGGGGPTFAKGVETGTSVGGSGTILYRDVFALAAGEDADLGPGRTFDLVTADGATTLRDLAAQEEEHFPLFVAQCVLALRFAREGGDAIVKFFEGSLARTRSVVAVMSRAFASVGVLKPHASRSCNSELYLVCRGRAWGDGVDEPLVLLRSCFGSCPEERLVVCREWDEELLEATDRLATEQTGAIRRAATLLERREGGRADARNP